MKRPGEKTRAEVEERGRARAEQHMVLATAEGDFERAREFFSLARSRKEIQESLRNDVASLGLDCLICRRTVAWVSVDSEGCLRFVGALVPIDPRLAQRTKNRIFDSTPGGTGEEVIASKGKVRIQHRCGGKIRSSELKDATTRRMIKRTKEQGGTSEYLP
jgi:hypothetical protein